MNGKGGRRFGVDGERTVCESLSEAYWISPYTISATLYQRIGKQTMLDHSLFPGK